MVTQTATKGGILNRGGGSVKYTCKCLYDCELLINNDTYVYIYMYLYIRIYIFIHMYIYIIEVFQY